MWAEAKRRANEKRKSGAMGGSNGNANNLLDELVGKVVTAGAGTAEKGKEKEKKTSGSVAETDAKIVHANGNGTATSNGKDNKEKDGDTVMVDAQAAKKSGSKAVASKESVASGAGVDKEEKKDQDAAKATLDSILDETKEDPDLVKQTEKYKQAVVLQKNHQSGKHTKEWPAGAPDILDEAQFKSLVERIERGEYECLGVYQAPLASVSAAVALKGKGKGGVGQVGMLPGPGWIPQLLAAVDKGNGGNGYLSSSSASSSSSSSAPNGNGLSSLKRNSSPGPGSGSPKNTATYFKAGPTPAAL